MTLRGVGGLAVLVCAAALNQVPAQTTVEVEAGKGVTIASQDGDTKINIGFYGQFRFQELSRDIWRKSDILQTFPDPVTGFAVENDGRPTRVLSKAISSACTCARDSRSRPARSSSVHPRRCSAR